MVEDLVVLVDIHPHTNGTGSYASDHQTYELVHGTTDQYTLKNDGGISSCNGATKEPSNATGIG